VAPSLTKPLPGASCFRFTGVSDQLAAAEFPQGLKPIAYEDFIGTAEAVPFQN
jgi:hypothetical protein